MVEPEARAGSEKGHPRILLQSVSGLLQGAGDLCVRVHSGLRGAARLRNMAQALGVATPLRNLADCARIPGAYFWIDLPDGAGGASASDKPLLLRHLHRLGRGGARPDP